MVALLAPRLLGERVGPRRWGAVLVGFLGVLVVMRPGAETAQLGAILSLGTAACYAVYQILARRVAGWDSPETTAGYGALAFTAVMTPIVPGLALWLGAALIVGGGLFIFFVEQRSPPAAR